MSRSEAEAAYCTQSVQAGLRLDGRALTAYRPMEVEVGIIPQANGSARLRLGDTDVMVGIKVGWAYKHAAVERHVHTRP